jgi:hypothetical protein
VSCFTFKGFIFALSFETTLRASVELCRHRMSSVEPRDYGRPSSALDEVSPKSAQIGRTAAQSAMSPAAVQAARVRGMRKYGQLGIGTTTMTRSNCWLQANPAAGYEILRRAGRRAMTGNTRPTFPSKRK